MRGYNYSTTVTVDVDVDIDENDLSDEDLREICDKRGILSGGLPGEVIEELFVLFKQGKHDQVLERVRQVVQDAKGVVL
jgi:hypothetical protein